MESSCVAVKRPGGRYYQSAAYPMSTYSTKPFNVTTAEWLGPAVTEVSAGGKGYISDGFFRVNANITIPAGKFIRGIDLCDLIGNIQIKDVHGVRIELTGREWVYCMYAEDQFVYVGDFIDNTSGQAGLTVNVVVYYHFPTLCHGLPAEETWWDLVEFHRGKWTLQFNASVGNGTNNTATVNAASTSLTAECEVTEKQSIDGHPEGIRRLRTVWRSTAMKANKDTIATAPNAVHRYAFYHTGSGAAKDTPDTLINATPATITSRLFGYALLDADFMAQMHMDRTDHFALSVSIGNQASVLYLASDFNPFHTQSGQTVCDESGVCQLLYYPRPMDPGITQLPVGDGVDFQTSQAFGSGSLANANSPAIVVAYLEDDPVAAAHCGESLLFPADAMGGLQKNKLNPFALLAYGNKLPSLLATNATVHAQPGDGSRNRVSVKSLGR